MLCWLLLNRCYLHHGVNLLVYSCIASQPVNLYLFVNTLYILTYLFTFLYVFMSYGN